MEARQLACCWRPGLCRLAGGSKPRTAPSRGALQVCAGAPISSNDFKPGVYIEVDGAPYRILGASTSGKPLWRPRDVTPLCTSLQSTCTSSRAKGQPSCARSWRTKCRVRQPAVLDRRDRRWSQRLSLAPPRCAGNTVEKTFRAGEKVFKREPREPLPKAYLELLAGGFCRYEQVSQPVHLHGGWPVR